MIKLKKLIEYDNAYALEATWYDPETNENTVCRVYSAEQMDELINDLGSETEGYEAIIYRMASEAGLSVEEEEEARLAIV